MPTTWTELVVSIVTPILFALLLLAARRVEAVILKNVQNTEAQAVLLRLNDTVFDLVGEMSQVLLDDVRAQAEQGKLPADVAKKAREDVLAKLKVLYGPDGVAKVRSVLGVDDEALEKLLVAKIEAAVARSKS
jgi:hypothetical protein